MDDRKSSADYIDPGKPAAKYHKATEGEVHCEISELACLF